MCGICEGELKRHQLKFCSTECRVANIKRQGASQPGTFKKGHRPWSKGRKGIRLSPATEFKLGQRSPRQLPVGAERVKRGRILVKTGDPSVWKARCRVVWESIHGPIPAGYIVVHKNGDRLDDRPENLELTTRAGRLNRLRATPWFIDKQRFCASVAMAQRHEVARNGEIATKMYPLPLYVRMMREGYVP